MIRLIGTTIRTAPDVVRVDVPLSDAHDLPQLARLFEKLAFDLRAIHQNESLNENGMLSDAYSVLRTLRTKLKKEFPK